MTRRGSPRVAHPSRSSRLERMKLWLFGGPRDLRDKSLFEKLSLLPFLAWVGLGADGLSSSSYGPMESFLALGEHRYLGVALALATVLTVGVIAAAYSRIIERFPQGGGGYLVASALLGRGAGVVSGCALLVDYVLTVTVSLAAAGDALFSFLPPEWYVARMPVVVALVLGLTVLNLRGVRESVTPLVPIFLLFVATHVALLVGAAWEHVADLPGTARSVAGGFRQGLGTLGLGGMLLLFARAWTMGGGTYTGLEAVSNGMPILREPRVLTARRTMLYMALSLALTAGGLLVCYLLLGISGQEGKTLNAVLSERVFLGLPGGSAIVIATLLSEGALLIVGAQAGFIDGPRVLANMAHDAWIPRRFASLSGRLTTRNGILLMGGAALAALLYTRGNVSLLVLMYSINVFLTFSLSMAGMLRAELFPGEGQRRRPGRILLFAVGLLLCATILVVSSVEKFLEGGWLTLAVTSLFAGLCFLIHAHYRSVGRRVAKLEQDVSGLEVPEERRRARLDPNQRTAAVLVGAYGGLGISTVRNVLRQFKGHYRNMIFISVGVVDSAALRSEETLRELRTRTEATGSRYVDLAQRLGMAAGFRFSVATDAVEELEHHCAALTHTFRDVTFFSGKLVFHKARFYHRWLHNETANELQRRLQFRGLTMVVLPTVVSASPRPG